MATKKVRIKTPSQARQKLEARKAKRVTVRVLIELLAKGDWDSEVTCISNRYAEVQNRVFNPRESRRRITAVSHNSMYGTQILFKDDD